VGAGDSKYLIYPFLVLSKDCINIMISIYRQKIHHLELVYCIMKNNERTEGGNK
jgi:hypothetical protein